MHDDYKLKIKPHFMRTTLVQQRRDLESGITVVIDEQGDKQEVKSIVTLKRNKEVDQLAVS